MSACYIVGIAGGTGSGKTTVAEAVMRRVGADRVLLLQHDAYYFDHPELPLEARAKINFDHPDSLESALLVTHLKALSSGAAVDIPIYDFSTHRRLERTRRVEPKPVVLIEGILALAEPRLRETMDMKVYVDTDADLRFIRRLERDIRERGRDRESVIRQYLKTVKPMHDQFVEPSKRYADIIVPEGGHNLVGVNLLVAKLRAILADGRVL